MAIQCKYCGVALPKDDARFCNKCGMLVPSHPLSPQSLSVSKSDAQVANPSSSSEQQERQKRVLREQVAELSPSPSHPQHVGQDEPVMEPDVHEQEAPEPHAYSPNQSSLTPTIVEELPLEKVPETPQPEFEEDISPQTDEAEELPLEKVPETPQPEFEEDVSPQVDEAVETSTPVVSSRQVTVRRPQLQSAQVPSSIPVWPAPVTYVAGKEASVPTQSVSTPVEDLPTAAVLQSHMAPSVSSPGYQSRSMSASITQDKGNVAPLGRLRRRWPIVAVFVLLLMFVIGGLGTAMLLSQPSSNDPVIQSQVSFSDTQLGIALLYPNGWIKQVDTTTSTAHFYASSHIGEVDILVATDRGNVQQALQQQATKMGMSGKKAGTTLTFATASWAQLQGTMQVSGASFMDTLLATSHGNRLFIIVQQAPQNNYTDWEKEFFVPLRDSFKFL